MQKVLVCSTERQGLRAEVVGWTFEDADNVMKAFKERVGTENSYASRHDMPVGLIRSGQNGSHCYPTILHALGDGWKLLAAPIEHQEQRQMATFEHETVYETVSCYEWWLVKD